MYDWFSRKDTKETTFSSIVSDMKTDMILSYIELIEINKYTYDQNERNQ